MFCSYFLLLQDKMLVFSTEVSSGIFESVVTVVNTLYPLVQWILVKFDTADY
jgi:hypothetical protein